MYNKIIIILKNSIFYKNCIIYNFFHFFLNIWNKYENYLWTKYNGGIIELPEFKMYLDPYENVISKSIFLHKTWEQLESKLFCRSISKGDIVIDIGAHIGWYSLLASQYVGKEGIVFAFEPEPRSFNILIKNIKINNIKNIVPVNKALSDSSGTQMLFINLYKKGPSPFRMWSNSDEEYIPVEVITLDKYLKNKQVNIIKIDVEGYECKIFRGMEKILSENPNLIIFSEYWPEGLRKSGSSPKEYLDIIERHDFKIIKIDEKLEKINYNEALDINKSTNFILFRERTQRLI